MRYKANITMIVSLDADDIKDAADKLKHSDLVNTHPVGMFNEYVFINSIRADKE